MSAQVVFAPISHPAAAWHFRASPEAPFTCDAMATPDRVDHDAKICAVDNDSPDWAPPWGSCPACMAARKEWLRQHGYNAEDFCG